MSESEPKVCERVFQTTEETGKEDKVGKLIQTFENLSTNEPDSRRQVIRSKEDEVSEKESNDSIDQRCVEKLQVSEAVPNKEETVVELASYSSNSPNDKLPEKEANVLSEFEKNWIYFGCSQSFMARMALTAKNIEDFQLEDVAIAVEKSSIDTPSPNAKLKSAFSEDLRKTFDLYDQVEVIDSDNTRLNEVLNTEAELVEAYLGFGEQQMDLKDFFVYLLEEVPTKEGVKSAVTIGEELDSLKSDVINMIENQAKSAAKEICKRYLAIGMSVDQLLAGSPSEEVLSFVTEKLKSFNDGVFDVLRVKTGTGIVDYICEVSLKASAKVASLVKEREEIGA